MGKSLTKRNNRGACGSFVTTSTCIFIKYQSAVYDGGTVLVGMTNHWMGWVSWVWVGGTEVPLSVGLDGMRYINPMDDSIVPSGGRPI